MKKGEQQILKSLDKGLKAKDLHDVIGIMESLKLHFKKHKEQNLVPFLETYYEITKRVLEKKVNEKNYFREDKC